MSKRETKKQKTERAIEQLVLSYSYTMEQIRLVNKDDQEAVARDTEWLAKHSIRYTDYLRKETKEKIDVLSELGYTGIASTFNYL